MCQPFSGQWMMLFLLGVGDPRSSVQMWSQHGLVSCAITVAEALFATVVDVLAECLDQWRCPGHLWGSTALHCLTQQRPRLSSAQGKSWPGALRGKGSLGAPGNPNSAACWASCVISVVRAYVAHNIRQGLGQLKKNERRPLQFQCPDLSVTSALFSFLCSVYQRLLVFSQSLCM